jgi:catalase
MSIRQEQAEEIVDAINDNFGVHAGCRAVHAKGITAEGTFTVAPEMAALTRAPHFRGGRITAIVRFSNGSGNPGAPDSARDGRGIAIELTAGDGSTTDLVGITLPVFFVRTADDFLVFTRARRPDPATGQPDSSAVLAFLG